MTKKQQVRVDPRKTAALLASTRDSEKVKEILLNEYGLKEKDVSSAIQEGRDALAIAADVDARMEFATRREQLEDLRLESLRLEVPSIFISGPMWTYFGRRKPSALKS